MLTVEKLSFSYDSIKGTHPVFKDLNINFGNGLNAVLGPNGAGKSTLLKCIFGLLSCHGAVRYGSEDITRMKTDDKTKLMSYLPQMDIEMSSLTVLEMVLLGRLPELGQRVSDEDLKSVLDTLGALNIAHLAPRSFSELSGGQKKLVFIAQTLVREPKIIMLDEPVNSLDLQKQLELCLLLQRIVQEKDVGIIVVLHDINLAARFADHIVVLDEKGGLYGTGTPHEVISETMLREVYGVVAALNHDENGTPTISPIRSIRDHSQT
jgi:iron complex transport system ATP-binding protein